MEVLSMSSVSFTAVPHLNDIGVCSSPVLTEDQHHTLKSLVGPVEEFLLVITLYCLYCCSANVSATASVSVTDGRVG